MGVIRPARPVNLICGFLSNDPDLIKRAVRLLTEHAGSTDQISERWPFDSTEFYEPEMGENLQRQFASFEALMDPAALAGVKRLTNQLEGQICYECGQPDTHRLVNLDPGYISLSKLVLATTKDYSHRVYLGDGIYAESTLHYGNGEWTAWPWTYPDYAETRYHDFLLRVRERYRAKLNAGADNGWMSKGCFA